VTYTESGGKDYNILAVLVGKNRRQGVAFLSLVRNGDLTPTATAFFVEIPWGVNRYITYAVTAAHCIDWKEPIYLEFSNKVGEYQRVETEPAQWFRSEMTDVACFRIKKPLDIRAINIDFHFVNPAAFIDGFVPGHEVYIVGLFEKSPYRDEPNEQWSIQPIVRFGKVALDETIAPVKLLPASNPDESTSVRARLIESLAFEGESGSPVFIYQDHVTGEPADIEASAYPKLFGSTTRPIRRNVLNDEQIQTPLFGLISAHWPLPSKVQLKRIGAGKAFEQGSRLEGSVNLNPGIAVVIPAEDIKEFLMKDPNVTTDRNQVAKRKASEPTEPLSAKPEDFTKDDFEAALRKVSRRIQPSRSDEGK
jgi:hypothetical protein